MRLASDSGPFVAGFLYSGGMLFDLPDSETLYAALTRGDSGYDGRAFVSNTQTGMFCRFSCPDPKPAQDVCGFHASVAACLTTGFTPCARCRPLHPPHSADPSAHALCTALMANPLRRWSEDDIRKRGLDPQTVRRDFKRAFGATFLDMARLLRQRAALETPGTAPAGAVSPSSRRFDTAARFRGVFANALGQPEAAFPDNARLNADWIETPLGPLIVVADTTHLHLLEFPERKALPAELKRLHKLVRGDIGFGRTRITDQTARSLAAYFDGNNAAFDVPLAHHGSGFARAVWAELQKIPAGQTRSYSQIADALGRPDAVRAVARANGANQIAILLPCHRVIAADGALTGYGGGLWRKQRLLALEAGYAS